MNTNSAKWIVLFGLVACAFIEVSFACDAIEKNDLRCTSVNQSCQKGKGICLFADNQSSSRETAYDCCRNTTDPQIFGGEDSDDEIHFMKPKFERDESTEE